MVKEIGHVWFNTMFSCPAFCGGVYVHGDQQLPYPTRGSKFVLNFYFYLDLHRVDLDCQYLFIIMVFPTAVVDRFSSLRNKARKSFRVKEMDFSNSGTKNSRGRAF